MTHHQTRYLGLFFGLTCQTTDFEFPFLVYLCLIPWLFKTLGFMGVRVRVRVNARLGAKIMTHYTNGIHGVGGEQHPDKTYQILNSAPILLSNAMDLLQ